MKNILGGKVVAIHQPNFFPWLGYFNKIAHADVFVVLDNVQFSKTGGTWTNRVRLEINGKVQWITMPVERSFEGVRLIRDMMVKETPWRSRLLQTLHHTYKRAVYYETVRPFLTELIQNPSSRVAEYNLNAIRAMADAMELDAKCVLASTLGVDGKATDLLIAIVKQVGGAAYLCGGGAGEYQEDESFAAEGIRLIYQDFQHPVYSRGSGKVFVAGLSIIDALMNCGFDGTRRLIMSSIPSWSNRAEISRSSAIP